MAYQSNNQTDNAQTFVQIPLISPQTLTTITNHNETNVDTTATMNDLNFMSPVAVDQAIKAAKQAFNSGKTKDVKFRKAQLRKFKQLLDDNKDVICKALSADLEKPRFETLICEYNLLMNEITEIL